MLTLVNWYWEAICRYQEWRANRLEATLTAEREDLAVEKAMLLTERKHLLADTERLEAEADQAEVDSEFYRILIFNNDGPEVQ